LAQKITPEQVILTQHYLWGMNLEELRILRNEYFAKYGMIFKSKDLTDYFSKYYWYKPQFQSIDNFLTEIDKKNIQLISQYEEKLKGSFNTFDVKNLDSSFTLMRKVKDPSSEYNALRTIEVSYDNNLKKTVDKTNIGTENQFTRITIESINEYYYEIEHFFYVSKYADDIKLTSDYYLVKYSGCCGADNFYEIFNRNTHEKLLEYHEKLLKVEIPNSINKSFIGFSHQNYDTTNLIVGELYFSSIEININKVLIKTRNKTDYDEIIPYFSPELSLKSKDTRDKLSEEDTMLTLWSKKSSQFWTSMDNFMIVIHYLGERTQREATLEIPIIQGYVNGKREKIQEVFLEFK
jgi:hypothetical protein